MPPEMLGRRPLDPRKVDVWCLGVSMYIAAFGAYPFDDAVPAPERFRTLDDGTLWAQARRSPRAARWSAGVLAVLSLMLVNDPRARASIPTLLAHPWFAPLHAAS
ncbi:hypothetical protein EON67_03320 [archaeon]|nr:MAG: hypothetical protein EON67_03320 [archaeon]